tara:strand:+ start:322 stop:423 length:102 start_codon:yes stop_codon:yes gene_type:complete
MKSTFSIIKRVDVGSLEILKSGRGNIAKKNHRI